MKKDNTITCISWCDADNVMNYGQLLQAFAMMHVLRGLSEDDISYISYIPRRLRSRVKYYLMHYNPFSGHLFGYIKTKKIIKKIINENRISFFQVFDKNKIEKIVNKSSILICGSDQIWHPQNYNPAYFLNLGSANALRISYAASLPKVYMEEQFALQYKAISDDIKIIDYISVREESSVNLVQSLCGKKVISVLDPTLLISNELWDSCIDGIDTPSQYIFVYIPNGMDVKLSRLVEKIQGQFHIKNVLVMQTRGNKCFIKANRLKYVSVGQFLFLIKNASYVVTSSFHATIFSVIFHKEFICYDVPNVERGEDIRLYDLLKMMTIENRLIKEEKNLDLIQPINYKFVDEAIELKKKESFNFLNKAVSNKLERENLIK